MMTTAWHRPKELPVPVESACLGVRPDPLCHVHKGWRGKVNELNFHSHVSPAITHPLTVVEEKAAFTACACFMVLNWNWG